jgi:hypothetical protein
MIIIAKLGAVTVGGRVRLQHFATQLQRQRSTVGGPALTPPAKTTPSMASVDA